MNDNPSELDKWLTKLLDAHPKQIALGLRRVRSVAERMCLKIVDKQIRLNSKVIIVGGTNGKGSVCAFLENILLSEGYTTTLYTSPHILTFKERLRSNGELLDDSVWIEAFSAVETAKTVVPKKKLTFFEFSTLAAILISNKLDPDVAIFEIGLGGRLDAVNLLDSDCAVLTSIDLDHENFLGNTREKIAWEKVHIARSGKPIVLAEENPPEILHSFCEKIGAKQIRVNRDYYYKQLGNQWSWHGRETTRHALTIPSLLGKHQLRNASAALACVESLSEEFPISQGSMRKALISVQLPGRLQVLAGQPTIVLDVAHNASAGRVGWCKSYRTSHYRGLLLRDRCATRGLRRLLSLRAWESTAAVECLTRVEIHCRFLLAFSPSDVDSGIQQAAGEPFCIPPGRWCFGVGCFSRRICDCPSALWVAKRTSQRARCVFF